MNEANYIMGLINKKHKAQYSSIQILKADKLLSGWMADRAKFKTYTSMCAYLTDLCLKRIQDEGLHYEDYFIHIGHGYRRENPTLKTACKMADWLGMEIKPIL